MCNMSVVPPREQVMAGMKYSWNQTEFVSLVGQQDISLSWKQSWAWTMGPGSPPIKRGGEFSPCWCQNLPGLDVVCFGMRRKIEFRSGFFGQRWLNLGNLIYILLQPPPGRSWCAVQDSRESLLPTTKSFPETRSRDQLSEMWVLPQEEPVFDTVVFIFLLYFKACPF